MSADKPKISRAHAACILFGKSHTRDNEVECLSKLDELGYGLSLCRYGNPERLVLVTNTYLNQHPSHYTEYPVISGSDDSEDQSSRESSPECGLLCKFYLTLVHLLYLTQRRWRQGHSWLPQRNIQEQNAWKRWRTTVLAWNSEHWWDLQSSVRLREPLSRQW